MESERLKMKDFIKKCPVFLILAASGLLFSLIGIVGRFSIYKEYEFHVTGRPYLTLMMEGISKGTMPWEAAEAIGMGADEFPGGWFYGWGNRGQMIGMPSEGEAAEAFPGGNEGDGSMSALGNGESDLNGQDDKGNPGEGEEGAAGNPEEAREEGAPGNPEEARGEGAPGKPVEEGKEGAAGNPEEAREEGTPGNSVEEGERKDSNGQGATETKTAGDSRTYTFQTVTEDYFNDAAFIGDSRTVGLFEYGGIEERADFYAKISLTIYDVFTTPVAKDEETGKKITVEEALMQKSYGKVYLMLGINELGTGTTDTFMEEYEKVVARIRELQPDAIIYVQGIMKVTGAKDAEDEIFNNTNIEDKNRAIAELADNRDIFYIDVNEVVCDAEGSLNAEYTVDEVHLKAKYYEIWKQFLLEHGIVK